MPLTPGQILQNRYRIISFLSRGGMGAIYQAWHLTLNIPVAIKEMVPQPGLARDALAQLRRQFQREANVLARLDHPHLVGVTDFFEEGGNVYLVMKFIEGENLAQRIERQGVLPEKMVLTWADQLLDALVYCHTQGVLHRDVKPHNVIIRPDGRAVLVDFGLVKLWDPRDPRTRTAMRGMGTPEYAPPEQYDPASGHTDARSDIYGLGATMYHALTGQAPPTATQRIARRRAFQPPRAMNPRISPTTEAVVLRAMELTVEDRFQSTQEMKAALAGRGAGPSGTRVIPPRPAPPVPSAAEGSIVEGPTPAPRVEKKKKGVIPTWVWGAGAAAAVAVLALLVVIALALGGGGDRTTPRTEEITTTVPAAATGAVRETATPLPSPSPTPVVSATEPAKSQPTRAPTKTPTSTPTPSPTETPRSRPTATPARASAPEPAAPAQGGTYQNPITFQWSGSLGAGQAYQVTARHTESGHTVQSEALTGQSWSAHLPAERYGEWRWTVAVVQGGSTTATSSEWMFWFQPGGGGGGGGGEGGTSTPPPP